MQAAQSVAMAPEQPSPLVADIHGTQRHSHSGVDPGRIVHKTQQLRCQPCLHGARHAAARGLTLTLHKTQQLSLWALALVTCAGDVPPRIWPVIMPGMDTRPMTDIWFRLGCRAVSTLRWIRGLAASMREAPSPIISSSRSLPAAQPCEQALFSIGDGGCQLSVSAACALCCPCLPHGHVSKSSLENQNRLYITSESVQRVRLACRCTHPHSRQPSTMPPES